MARSINLDEFSEILRQEGWIAMEEEVTHIYVVKMGGHEFLRFAFQRKEKVER